VSSLSMRLVRFFIRLNIFLFCFFAQVSVKAWEVDMSRRNKDLRTLRMPASIVDTPAADQKSILGSVFEATEPTQEIVILNTDEGFVPQNIKVKKGNSYKFHVVNVSQKQKNISFVMDAFSEHHATYFGDKKSFVLTPKVDGAFSFQCPETAKEGTLTVYTDPARKPASN